MPSESREWKLCPVIRASYHAVLPGKIRTAALDAALQEFSKSVERLRRQHWLLTASLFRYQAHLFLYMESVGTALTPDGLSPLLDALLLSWPGAVGDNAPRRWVAMQPYFYHDVPTTAADWLRGRHPSAQHGRIALLKPDKWCSYMEHHLKLVREGLLEGDRWHLICVQENLLFSYLEEPRTHTNIRHQPGVPSAELQDWLAADPESHFEHFAEEQQGPDAPNFVYLPRCAGTYE